MDDHKITGNMIQFRYIADNNGTQMSCPAAHDAPTILRSKYLTHASRKNHILAYYYGIRKDMQ